MGQHSTLYKMKVWCDPRSGLRIQQLTKEPLCRKCKAFGYERSATIADHIEPHRGDIYAFLHNELQSLCKPCHDSDKQSEEVRGYSTQVGVDGWPDDPRHPVNKKD